MPSSTKQAIFSRSAIVISGDEAPSYSFSTGAASMEQLGIGRASSVLTRVNHTAAITIGNPTALPYGVTVETVEPRVLGSGVIEVLLTFRAAADATTGTDIPVVFSASDTDSLGPEVPLTVLLTIVTYIPPGGGGGTTVYKPRSEVGALVLSGAPETPSPGCIIQASNYLGRTDQWLQPLLVAGGASKKWFIEVGGAVVREQTLSGTNLPNGITLMSDSTDVFSGSRLLNASVRTITYQGRPGCFALQMPIAAFPIYTEDTSNAAPNYLINDAYGVTVSGGVVTEASPVVGNPNSLFLAQLRCHILKSWTELVAYADNGELNSKLHPDWPCCIYLPSYSIGGNIAPTFIWLKGPANTAFNNTTMEVEIAIKQQFCTLSGVTDLRFLNIGVRHYAPSARMGALDWSKGKNLIDPRLEQTTIRDIGGGNAMMLGPSATLERVDIYNVHQNCAKAIGESIVMRDSEFAWANIGRFNTQWDAAQVKCTRDDAVSANIIWENIPVDTVWLTEYCWFHHNQGGHGLWFDVRGKNFRVQNSTAEDNGRSGFFGENGGLYTWTDCVAQRNTWNFQLLASGDSTMLRCILKDHRVAANSAELRLGNKPDSGQNLLNVLFQNCEFYFTPLNSNPNNQWIVGIAEKGTAEEWASFAAGGRVAFVGSKIYFSGANVANPASLALWRWKAAASNAYANYTFAQWQQIAVIHPSTGVGTFQDTSGTLTIT